MPAAAALVPAAAAGLVQPILSSASDLAKQRVIGWERTTTKVKKGKTVTERAAFEVQAWEIVLGAAVGAIAYWIVLWQEEAERTQNNPNWEWLLPPWTWPFTRPWEGEPDGSGNGGVPSPGPPGKKRGFSRPKP